MSDLLKLGRGDLDTVAAALGVTEPEKMQKKDEVADAIVEKITGEPETVAAAILANAHPVPKLDTRPIDRKTTIGATPGHEDLVRAWWCPFCDTSNGGEITKCTGCGAERDADTETATRQTYEG